VPHSLFLLCCIKYIGIGVEIVPSIRTRLESIRTMGKSRRAIIVACLVLVVGMLGGCYVPEPVPTAKLEILDYSLDPNDNTYMPWVITGHAKNVSGGILSYAEVDGQFFDEQDVLLATWIDNANSLQAGVVWEFSIYLMDSGVADRVHHATVEVGSCW